jgi:uncharacterized protein YecE (DUF72 family)
MHNKTRGILRIGTSGIVVHGSKQNYPLEFQNTSRLHYYSSLFNTVEVNSTFRKIPLLSTFEKWSLDVQEDFQFTIKLWKEVTHVKQLDIQLDYIDKFMNAANHIGNKKGGLLIQFPGSITVEYSSKVMQILQRLTTLDHQNEWRKVVEFRSITWYTDEINDVLDKYNVALVMHDMPKSKNFKSNEGTGFIYYRFHGPKGDYRGSYDNEFLEEHAEKIEGYLNNGKDVYAYFNNTMGNAFENAMSLKAMVERNGLSV